jgi:hypothetical protein
MGGVVGDVNAGIQRDARGLGAAAVNAEDDLLGVFALLRESFSL